ncbi:MAG: phage Gp37/Gp68 family protein [Bacteroidia bacterium]
MKLSKIEWTEATWNPSTGCNKVSAGCKFCYAEVMSNRLQAMGTRGYENGFEFTLVPERLTMPLKIKKPTKFFVNSMSDLFHEKMPFDYLDSVFEVISNTPHHTYQILTKRPHILINYTTTRKIPNNVWMGVSVENPAQKFRIDLLRSVDASIRFLSLEPLLEDLGEINLEGIDWVIVGGESGNKARPMEHSWIENIQSQCEEEKVAFFFKQWGTWGADGIKRNKSANGRLFEGQEWNEEPQIIKVN